MYVCMVVRMYACMESLRFDNVRVRELCVNTMCINIKIYVLLCV